MHFKNLLTAIALVEEFIGEMDLAAYTSDASRHHSVPLALSIRSVRKASQESPFSQLHEIGQIST
jgi:hypothetical protein